MIEHHWPPPPRRLDAATALRSIRQQHELIRKILDAASADAMATLDGSRPPTTAASSFGHLRAAFLAHLAFEEGALIPILQDDLPLGPDRALRLLEEHARQREILDALYEEAKRHPTLPTLAIKLASLADALLADMLEEEEFLLTPDIVRDDQIVIDQTCG